ncbi:FG-GAP-like repeat-containing protein [Geoanaerobacter pelophilus]|uniref:FG-GAP-like repeat-containing protein n=1 Tax=Geoanaerobacter pelophilus TaxID=60036 RepID=UPI000A26C9BB|nr:FG-GAP-like repeat-containing protein [Geoanaerobacter pelophilus]
MTKRYTLVLALFAFGYLLLPGPGLAALQPGFDQKQVAVIDSGAYKTRAWGLAIADFTGDGVPDIVSGSTSGYVHLYVGTGDGTYASPSTVLLNLGVHNAYGLVSGDFNGDGAADLVLCPINGDNGLDPVGDSLVKLYLGIGNGAFRSPVTIGDAGTDAMALVAGDVDGDGRLDLISGDQTNSTGNTADVLLFRNLGTDVNGVPAWSSPTTIISAPRRTPVDPEQPPYFPPKYYFQSYGLALADIDGDGDLELLVSDLATYLYVYSNDGLGHFQPVRYNRIATRPFAYAQLHGDMAENQSAIAAADLNGDGLVDIVAGGDQAGYNYNWEGKVDLWLNEGLDSSGRPTFASVGIIGGDGTNVRGLAVGQLNPKQDSTTDVLFGNNEGRLSALFADTKDSDGDGIIDRWDNAPLISNAPRLDINGDGFVNRFDQLDADHDGIGDVADDDNDNDGVPDTIDNAIYVANHDQADSDGDGVGDVSDPLFNRDTDGDGVPDAPLDQVLQGKAQQAKALWSQNDTHFIIRVDSLGRIYQNEFVQTFLDAAILSPAEWALRKGESYNGKGDAPAPTGYTVPAGLAGGKETPVSVFVIPKQLWATSGDPDPINWINARITDRNLEVAQHGTYHAYLTNTGDWKDQEDRNWMAVETAGFTFPEMFEYLRIGKETLLGDYADPWIVQSGATPTSARIDWSQAAHPLISYAPPYDASDIPARQAIAHLGYVAFSASVWEETNPIFSPEGSHHQTFDQFGMYHASADRQVDPVGTDVAGFLEYLDGITRRGALNTFLIEQTEWSGRYCNDLPRLGPCATSPSNINEENNTIDLGRWEKWLALLDFAKTNGSVMTMGEYALAMSFDNAPTAYNPNQKDADHNGIGDAIDGAALSSGEIRFACAETGATGILAATLATPLAGVPQQLVSFRTDADGDGVTEEYDGATDGAGKVAVPIAVAYPVGSVIPYTASWDGILANAQAEGTVRVTAQASLLPPMAKLVSLAEDPPLPTAAYRQGRTVPLRLQLTCGSKALTAAEVAPPRIVAIERAGESVALTTIDLDAGQANDNGLDFRFAGDAWIYNLDTRGLSAGAYRVTIQMPDGVGYRAAFVLM